MTIYQENTNSLFFYQELRETEPDFALYDWSSYKSIFVEEKQAEECKENVDLNKQVLEILFLADNPPPTNIGIQSLELHTAKLDPPVNYEPQSIHKRRQLNSKEQGLLFSEFEKS